MLIDHVAQVLGQDIKWNGSGTEAQFKCPFCNDYKRRLGINRTKLLVNCFNCGWGGNVVSFFKKLQNLSWSEALDIVNFYQEFKPLPNDLYEEIFDKLYVEDVELEKKRVKLPEGFKSILECDSVESIRCYNYAVKRGLTEKQMELHGLGYAPGKTSERLIIQVRDDNQETLYWQARAISPRIKPKTLNPPGNINTLNKSDVLFNLNNAKSTGVVVLTEGVFDATTIGRFGVCMFGKKLSMKQLLLLVKAEIKRVYVMLDPDARLDAVKLASLLSKHIDSVYLCDLKGGDPNDVGPKGCLDAIKNAERFDKFTQIKYKLLQ